MPRSRPAGRARTASGLRQAERALALADDDRERCASYEAVGDALLDGRADREGVRGVRPRAGAWRQPQGCRPADMARLRWKWVDAPTRWSASKAMAAHARADRGRDRPRPGRRGRGGRRGDGGPAADRRRAVHVAGRDGRGAAGARADGGRPGAGDRRAAGPAGHDVGRPRRADGAAPRAQPLRRGRRERRGAGSRCSPKIRWREEQMDVCAASARTRQALGDFAGSVEAVRKAEQLAAARRSPVAVAAGADPGRDLLPVGPLGRRARLLRAVPGRVPADGRPPAARR